MSSKVRTLFVYNFNAFKYELNMLVNLSSVYWPLAKDSSNFQPLKMCRIVMIVIHVARNKLINATCTHYEKNIHILGNYYSQHKGCCRQAVVWVEDGEKNTLLFITSPANQTNITKNRVKLRHHVQWWGDVTQCRHASVLISPLRSDHFLRGQRLPGPLPWVWSRLRWHAHPLQPLQLH